MKKTLVIMAALIASPAFALFSPLPESSVTLQRWQPAFIGETLVDGIRTVAVVEESAAEVSAPGQLTGKTLLPHSVKEEAKQYRLSLVAVDQPNLRARFGLVRQTAFVDGKISKVLLSRDNAQGFRFVIRSVEDGRMEAVFSREGEASIQQRFELVPAVQVM